VQAIVGTEAKPGDYWHTATVAEVQLIQRNFAKAAKLYEVAPFQWTVCQLTVYVLVMTACMSAS